MSGDIIIVGGGFAGLAAGAALSQGGARVRVLERADTVDRQFRGELIHPKGVRTLAALGFADALRAAGGVAIDGFAVSPSASRELTLLSYPKRAGQGLGIDHPLMVQTMRHVAASEGVTVITNQHVVDVMRSAERVTGVVTADGTTYTGDLVVLADGRQSRLRAGLGFGSDVNLLSYTVALGLEGVALPGGARGHVFLGGPGPILAYPYATNKIRFCLDIPRGAPKGKAGLAAYMIAHHVPQVPTALGRAMADAIAQEAFVMCGNHAISTAACAAPGVVLVGDAGGCAHPLTASGMTNALHDVTTLAEAVRERGLTDDALTHYQRRRYDYIRMREIFTDALYEVFRGDEAGASALQEGVFRYWRDPDHRDASMDILSGENVKLGAFVAEYVGVLGQAAAGVVADGAGLRGRATDLRRIGQTSGRRLESAVRTAARHWLSRSRHTLRPLPRQDANSAQTQ